MQWMHESIDNVKQLTEIAIENQFNPNIPKAELAKEVDKLSTRTINLGLVSNVGRVPA